MELLSTADSCAILDAEKEIQYDHIQAVKQKPVTGNLDTLLSSSSKSPYRTNLGHRVVPIVGAPIVRVEVVEVS